MCDYSLIGVASRPARVAEKLASVAFFREVTTRGFASVDDKSVAVCLQPGTEIAFEDHVRVRGFIFRKTVREKLARFRKINMDRPYQYHDALEFADGTIVLVNDLVAGQHAIVLQLPARSNKLGHQAEQNAPRDQAEERLGRPNAQSVTP
jgi:hypothetical protein